MPRRHVLATYDVSDDKRRDRVFETLHDFGDHLQFSVFLCQLSPAELASLRALLSAVIHDKQDQVILVDLGDAGDEPVDLIQTLGRPLDQKPRSFIV